MNLLEFGAYVLWIALLIVGLAALVLSGLPEAVNKPFTFELGITMLVVWLIGLLIVLFRWAQRQSKN